MNLQTLIDNGVLNQCKFAEVTQIVLYYKDKEEYWNYFTNILFSSSFESSENRKFLTDKQYSINSKIKVIISREVISKENVYEILKNAENMQEWKWKDDVVSVVAPDAKPVVVGGKIIYYSADGTKAVVADVSGYLRVQDLTKKTRKRQYLDQFGKDAHNVVESNGKKRGRSKSEFQKATHYMIKKRM